jgi:hypothetical protein
MVRHSVLDAVDVQQIRDEPNLDVDQTSVDVVRHFHLVYLDVEVDVVRHLKMDCYLHQLVAVDAVAELMRMDYFQVAVDVE